MDPAHASWFLKLFLTMVVLTAHDSPAERERVPHVPKLPIPQLQEFVSNLGPFTGLSHLSLFPCFPFSCHSSPVLSKEGKKPNQTKKTKLIKTHLCQNMAEPSVLTALNCDIIYRGSELRYFFDKMNNWSIVSIPMVRENVNHSAVDKWF